VINECVDFHNLIHFQCCSRGLKNPSLLIFPLMWSHRKSMPICMTTTQTVTLNQSQKKTSQVNPKIRLALRTFFKTKVIDPYHRIDIIFNNLDQVEQSGHHQQTGRMIVMKDTAYTTYACIFLVVIVRVLRFFFGLVRWKSLLFYLHTEDIVFSSLKSRPPVPVDIVLPETAPQAPPCSPKSMYRLADKVK